MPSAPVCYRPRRMHRMSDLAGPPAKRSRLSSVLYKDLFEVSEWVSYPSTHCRSFRRRSSLSSQSLVLTIYTEQPGDRKYKHKIGPNATRSDPRKQHKTKENWLRGRTAWFSRLLRYTARKRSGSILLQPGGLQGARMPEPARGIFSERCEKWDILFFQFYETHTGEGRGPGAAIHRPFRAAVLRLGWPGRGYSDLGGHGSRHQVSGRPAVICPADPESRLLSKSAATDVQVDDREWPLPLRGLALCQVSTVVDQQTGVHMQLLDHENRLL